MHTIFKTVLVTVAMSLAASSAQAAQYVVELSAPLDTPSSDHLLHHSITLDQAFSAGPDSYAVFSASTQNALEQFLEVATIQVEKISEVLFVNSPVVGGGQAAGKTPREGHQVFVIERPVPGIGTLPLAKQQEISQGSNAANTTLGDVIEWDHSYLTNEGTYCVYRADSPDAVREQATLSGAPIGKITAVKQHAF